MSTPEERAQQLAVQSDAAWIRDWRHTESYDVYLRHLDAAIAGWVERVLAGDAQQFLYLKGLVDGLRIARNLPQTIEMNAKRLVSLPTAPKVISP